ncbi:hypothetical protein HAX54_031177 [Datura stramonium]|uniref:CASP-like protein n=1 Tax=Datura stramonium TaxID=4076 RepID=A0ABS8VB65_DATST|nr:hypothetical protein [Datura stramonium]
MGGLTQKNVVENENNGSNMAETMLRLVPMALCVVALVIMLKDSQTNNFGSLSYSDLGTFRYLVHANGICAAYSLLSAIISALPRPTTLPRAWTFFLLDQVLTYIILAAGAASTEVVYLGYKGDTAVTWSETCGSFGGFCRKATASVSITFIVSLCYVGISLLSSYRLFSKYDAPVVGHYNNKGGVEISTY